METYSILHYTPRHEDVWVSGGITTRILKLGARWRLMVSLTPRPLCRRTLPPVPIG